MIMEDNNYGEYPVFNTEYYTTDKNIDDETYERRKAQNRAAQRAFRERKEGKLRELTIKLQNAEKEREKLEIQLKQLREKNVKLGMENQILLSGGSSSISISPVSDNRNDNIMFKFPTKKEFINKSVDLSQHDSSNSNILIGQSYEINDEKLLTISAIWDYLVEFKQLNEDVEINISKIMEELRGKEKCHGFGPAYKLSLVNEIIIRHVM